VLICQDNVHIICFLTWLGPRGVLILSKIKVVVWMVRDSYRILDNPSWVKACQIACESSASLVPVACLEPRRWESMQFGVERAGPHWKRFRAESVIDLGEQLKQMEIDLYISPSSPVDAINELDKLFQVIAVVIDEPLSVEERYENQNLVLSGVEVITSYTDDLFVLEQLPFELGNLPETFSKFRKTVERNPELTEFDLRTTEDIPPKNTFTHQTPLELIKAHNIDMPAMVDVPLKGGETSGLRHWKNYCDSGALTHYKETRNAFYGVNNSSHLSAWLAHGCISPRKVWNDVLQYEREKGANESTYWLRFELLWREYFRWYSRAHGEKLFLIGGASEKKIKLNFDEVIFESWCRGETGSNIVDAGMRELNATGWVSNRARQLLASHLIYELNIDWRYGAAYFESQLIDFDVASNWGNWAYIAGVGADPRGGRIFNLDSQADRYDPEKKYRSFWLGQEVKPCR